MRQTWAAAAAAAAGQPSERSQPVLAVLSAALSADLAAVAFAAVLIHFAAALEISAPCPDLSACFCFPYPQIPPSVTTFFKLKLIMKNKTRR